MARYQVTASAEITWVVTAASQEEAEAAVEAECYEAGSGGIEGPLDADDLMVGLDIVVEEITEQ